ncbi:MAG: FAD-binding oxidoreductase [Saprospiraceae bacterium]|nr:FAD-binding oxidoreductase [Saprospiraceae bacterium]
MGKPKETYDFAIVGGGLFGVYAALFLAEKGCRVVLVEKEQQLMAKASIVNQARLHSGYHYPRSIATALMSDDNKARFTQDHQAFIHASFDKYYAIDQYSSFTDGAQFERFCEFIGLPCQKLDKHPSIRLDRLEALFLTQEYTFDPILMANYYRRRLEEASSISVLKFHELVAAKPQANQWQVTLKDLNSDTPKDLVATQVINATYANSNGVNRRFGLSDIPLMHEISEMAFVSSPQLKDLGLTIMDGQFASIMPYGLSGLLSLSSVAYTHHKVAHSPLPTFDCQKINTNCRPDFPSICNSCFARPASNYSKMKRQIQLYLREDVQLFYLGSMFTIKSKLKANHIDDGRPTEIAILNENPRFYCIFAGKINSIYEIEKVIKL